MHKDLKVSRQDLQNEYDDDWGYLYVILQKYYELHDSDPHHAVDNFTDMQHALMAYSCLDAQVCNGGFIQLIYNGYGSYVLESPLIQKLKEWGVENTPQLLDKVNVLYQEAKISNQEDDSLEDFANLYNEHPEFEEYDDLYYEINDAATAQVRKFVENNLDQFIIVE